MDSLQVSCDAVYIVRIVMSTLYNENAEFLVKITVILYTSGVKSGQIV